MTWIGSPPAIWAASSSTVIPGTVSAAEPSRVADWPLVASVNRFVTAAQSMFRMKASI